MLKLLISCLGIAILAYNLYTPIPEQITAPWKIQLYLGLKNILHSTFNAGTMIGLWHYHTMMRLTHSVIFPSRNPINDSDITVIETLFDGVEVLISLPAQKTSKLYPGLIYIHGGGFVLLSARQLFPVTLELTKILNVAVVSINYRLAPEYPFPIPHQDCVSATIHLLKNAANYGIDPLRISISGDSAGGNLATSVALKLREHKDLPPLKSQVLIYPFIQALDFLLPSYQQNSKFLISAEMLSFYTLLYVNEDLDLIPTMAVNNHTSPELKRSKVFDYLDVRQLPKRFTEINYIRPTDDFGDIQISKRLESKLLNPYAFPLMADDLKGLPPALVLVCHFDPLRDEGLLYAHRLKKAGVKVQEYIVEGGIHGSLNLYHTTEMGKETMNVITKYLRTVM